jgi:hypothetical protein
VSIYPGQAVLLICEVVGDPIPEVSFKSLEPLKPKVDQEVETTVDEEGKRLEIRLTITAVSVGDDVDITDFTNTLVCTATNDQGVASDSKEIKIRPIVFSEGCLSCLCNSVSDGCSMKTCTKEGKCGIFGISENYWRDCGSPGEVSVSEKDKFIGCVMDEKCAKGCVRAYIKLFVNRCVNPGEEPTCGDFASLHFLGPSRCRETPSPPRATLIRSAACCRETGYC